MPRCTGGSSHARDRTRATSRRRYSSTASPARWRLDSSVSPPVASSIHASPACVAATRAASFRSRALRRGGRHGRLGPGSSSSASSAGKPGGRLRTSVPCKNRGAVEKREDDALEHLGGRLASGRELAAVDRRHALEDDERLAGLRRQRQPLAEERPQPFLDERRLGRRRSRPRAPRRRPPGHPPSGPARRAGSPASAGRRRRAAAARSRVRPQSAPQRPRTRRAHRPLAERATRPRAGDERDRDANAQAAACRRCPKRPHELVEHRDLLLVTRFRCEPRGLQLQRPRDVLPEVGVAPTRAQPARRAPREARRDGRGSWSSTALSRSAHPRARAAADRRCPPKRTISSSCTASACTARPASVQAARLQAQRPRDHVGELRVDRLVAAFDQLVGDPAELVGGAPPSSSSSTPLPQRAQPT